MAGGWLDFCCHCFLLYLERVLFFGTIELTFSSPSATPHNTWKGETNIIKESVHWEQRLYV